MTMHRQPRRPLSATPEQWERWDKRARRAGVRWAVLVRALLDFGSHREPPTACSVCDEPLPGFADGGGTHVVVGQVIVAVVCPSCAKALTDIPAQVRRSA